MKTNLLYSGDNLDILRGKYIDAESIDLIYLDPPFNSNRDYNVIFADESGRKSAAQIVAFTDIWHWGPKSEEHFGYLTDSARNRGQVPANVSTLIAALLKALGKNQMMAYLVEMGIRLVELKRVLKKTGALYLHCDPTASHYLKLLLDALFGPTQFQNEFIWYYGGGGASKRRWGRKHDVLLFYTKSQKWTFNMDAVREPHKWTEGQLRADGSERDLEKGKIADDVWQHHSILPWSSEWLDWPTQKPLALLERVIKASSNPGDVVLDPFCGCGTALVAAEKLKRKWIGIDVSYLSIAVMQSRLEDEFGLKDIDIEGLPTEEGGVRQLVKSERGPFKAQQLAVTMLRAAPTKGDEVMPGADDGIDGKLMFTDEDGMQTVIISVKTGKPKLSEMRDLVGVVSREDAAIAVYVTLEPATPKMKDEAARAGLYYSKLFDRRYPKVQVITFKELVEERKRPDLPPSIRPSYKKARRYDALAAESEQQPLTFDDDPDDDGT